MPSFFPNLKWPKGVARKVRKHSDDGTGRSCPTLNQHPKVRTSRSSKVHTPTGVKRWESLPTTAATGTADRCGTNDHDIVDEATASLGSCSRNTDGSRRPSRDQGFSPSLPSSMPPPRHSPPFTPSGSLRRCRSSSASALSPAARSVCSRYSASDSLVPSDAEEELPPALLPLAALPSHNHEDVDGHDYITLTTLDEEDCDGSSRLRKSRLPSSLLRTGFQARSNTILETSLVLQKMRPLIEDVNVLPVDQEVEALARSILLRAVAKEQEHVVDKINRALDSLAQSAPHVTRADLSTCALWLYCDSDGRASDVIQCLLDANASPFAYGVSAEETRHLVRVPPFYLCVGLGMVEIVDYFLTDESAENVNMDYVCDITGESVLECAVHNKDAVMAQLLIGHGAAVNATIEDARSSADGSPRRMKKALNDTDGAVAVKKVGRSTVRTRADVQNKTPDSKDAHDSGSSSITEWSTGDGRRVPLLHIALAASDKDVQLIICTTLLRHAADVEGIGNGGARPLHVTAQCGSAELTDLLLGWGANPTSTDESSAPPLLYAASGGHVDVVRILLAGNARVNDVDGSGTSPLIGACKEHHVDVVRELLDAHADVNARDDDGGHALLEAARCGHADVAHMLIDASADVNATTECSAVDVEGDTESLESSPTSDRGPHTRGGLHPLTTTALREAARGGHVNCVRALLAARAQCNDVDEKGNTPLHSACERADNSDVVHALLPHLTRATMELANVCGQRALDVAVLHDADATALLLVREMPTVLGEMAHAVLIRLLHACPQFHTDGIGAHVMGDILTHRMDHSLRAVTDTLLFEAIRHKNLDCVNHLLAHNATVHKAGRDDNGCTVLHSAARSGMYSMFQVLFFRGGAHIEDVDMNDNEGKTPLIHAAQGGNVACVGALALYGCDIHAVDAAGRTALYHAASVGHTAICETLIRDYGARVDDVTHDGTQSTILHAAAMSGSMDTCELLLSYLADSHARTSTHATPLLEAAFGGHTQVCDLLIAAQADVNAEDAHGVTPLLDAACAGHVDTVALLLSRGAHVAHRGPFGHTALDAAAYHGHAAVCSELLAHHAEVNACDTLGWTPLLTASLQGHPHVIDVLARCTALHWGHKDEQGLTALKLARTLGHHALAEKLCGYGAEDVLDSDEEGEGGQLAILARAKSRSFDTPGDSGATNAEKIMGQFTRMWGRRKTPERNNSSSTPRSAPMRAQMATMLQNINRPVARKLKIAQTSLASVTLRSMERPASPLPNVTKESRVTAVIGTEE
eukprot:GEMP01001208.1.p1 GENE.GEMP01001208.1~~GEMP01001208.1.p1  ORF type:complete len:1273 (+),score=336.13 GEMP01001208.1:424-4242(+)